MIAAAAFRRALLAWFDRERRSLPWREARSFYRVWLSEIMLQQTRVEAVIPHFHRFLERFPAIEDLAAAPESDVLAAWAGLGYYSRARSLHRAAKQIAAEGVPETYEAIRALPGVGEYTAAAVGSIVYGAPKAAVEGNVLRVVSRLTNDAAEITAPATRRRMTEEAQRLLAPRRAGDFNEAMMELGATVCTPRAPKCAVCPLHSFCEAQANGTVSQLPVKARKAETRDIPLELAVIERAGEVLLVKRAADSRRLAGFFELPLKSEVGGGHRNEAGGFTHQIVNDRFRVRVWTIRGAKTVPEGQWQGIGQVHGIPLTTMARKALKLVFENENAGLHG